MGAAILSQPGGAHRPGTGRYNRVPGACFHRIALGKYLFGQRALDTGAILKIRPELKGNSWHNVRAQPGAYEGTKTAALPTLGIEGQFSAALQT